MMINIHWSWLVFMVVVIGFVGGIIYSSREHRSSYIDLITPLIFIALAVFILIWGGIFWW